MLVACKIDGLLTGSKTEFHKVMILFVILKKMVYNYDHVE